MKQKYLVSILVTIFTILGIQSSYAQTITASTPHPLTESNLHGSVVTLTLSGRSFTGWSSDIGEAITISGIDGVTFDDYWDVDRISDTKVTVELTFSGNIDADTSLTFTVGAGGIADYDGEALTAQLPVTAVEESLVPTTEAPLTEATLNGSVVTLTLSGRVFNDEYDVYNALTVSGIEGASFYRFDVERISNTKVTVPLTFAGNIDADTTLTLTVGANAIIGYNEAFTLQLPVTALEETLVATTAAPLTEANLHRSVVTLTLSGRSFTGWSSDIGEAITISGIDGVTFDDYWDVDRISDTKVTVELTFSGNIDTDATLTVTVGADAIIGYNQAFTLQVPVTAVEETLVATTTAPLTEATLNGSVVTLTLDGRVFNTSGTVSVSGIEGVTISRVSRVSNTQMRVSLTFSGNIDADSTLTIIVSAARVASYNEGFTIQVPVTAVTETLVATTEAPLTEATLSDSVVTLTLSGRSFVEYSRDPTITLSGIEGANIARYGIERVSDTKMTVALTFSGNIDVDSTLTITVSAAGIAGYNQGFTVQLPVTAVEESLVATTEAPLTETTLSGSVVKLTLSGRSFVAYSSNIAGASSISGIEGVTGSFRRVSNTEATITLGFSENIDADSTLTITVGADAIVGYNQAFTLQVPVTAVEETLVATTEAPLTEATLSDSVVTLTLSGRSFTRWGSDIRDALSVTGIEGVSFYRFGVERINNTKVTVPLTFAGNIDANTTLTVTVGADAIVGYNQGFTLQLPVTAVEESLVATTETPLTETTLSGSVVTLTLSGRNFTSSESDIRDALSVTGIEGVSVSRYGVDRASHTEATVVLISTEDFDTDSVLTLTVGADAIVGYNEGFTFDFPVTAVEESLIATTETPLTEANLTGSVVTLTLSGRHFTDEWDIERALTFSGIEGVSIPSYDGVERVSNTEAKVTLLYSGNIDTDSTFTLEVGAGAITSYNEGFTFEFPVTAVEERLEVSTESPLTEAALNGGTITLTLIGRQFTWWRRDIEEAVTLTGIEGLSIGRFSVDRETGDVVLIPLVFDGNIDTDATLTIEVGAGAIAGYNEAFTAQIPVVSVEESLDISSKFNLNEATLNGTEVILKLNGRSYVSSFSDIRNEVSVTGIEGVTFDDFFDVDRVNDNEVAVELSFDGTDFDIDSTLTFTVGAEAISGYGEALTAQLPVTAIKQSNGTISISPNPVVSPPLFEQLTVSLNITSGENVAGFQAIVWYDDDTLRYVESAKGNYLPADAFFVAPTVPEYEYYPYPYVPIATTALDGVSNGNGTLATVTFEVYDDIKESKITLTNVYIVDREGIRWEVEIEGTDVTEPAHDVVGDINRDGLVNIRDLVLVSWRFGLRDENRADINGDGIVDIADLVLVANALGADAAAPSLNPQILEQLTAADVKEWLTQAQKITLTDPDYKRGISVLEQLHKALTPKTTALLPNFPNPFNPETWIPYHLSKDADVTLHIYAINGTLVRTLALGHQAAGRYQSRSRAAYWDGKNEFGESVASGVYFYTLTAGDFTATRKMLIRK